MRELILKLNREYQITVLISSHILDVVERVCNKIAVIKDGKLVYEGATEEATRLNNLESFFMELNHADAISSL